MNYLLDTNLVSEWVKPRPDRGAISWLARADEDRLFVSVVTLAELRYGIARMRDGSRRRHLDAWLRHDLPLRFDGRVLAVSDAVADEWGEVVAQCEVVGRPIGAIDAFIAATVKVHGLTLVTRDTSDFEPVLTTMLNPWTGG